MKTVPFFLRFYGRSDDEIRQCLEELRELDCVKSMVRYRITDTRMSCNLFIPEDKLPARELTLYFNNLAECVSCHCDEVETIYAKWSQKNRTPGSVIMDRRPKDLAFGV